WACPGLADTGLQRYGRCGKVLMMGQVFTREFREQIVALHLGNHKSYKEIAAEYGLSATTVSNWVRAAKREQLAQHRPAKSAETEQSARIAELERQLARKEEEVRILGKALAFFARREEL
ncbi:transposase, partial [Mycobacterium sp. MUNTM1]